MSGVDYLYEPHGAELHWDGMRPVSEQQQAGGRRVATLISSHPADTVGMQGSTASHRAHAVAPVVRTPVRQITPEELMAQAQAMLAEHKIQSEAQLGAGASVGDRDDAGNLLPGWLKGAAER